MTVIYRISEGIGDGLPGAECLEDMSIRRVVDDVHTRQRHCGPAGTVAADGYDRQMIAGIRVDVILKQGTCRDRQRRVLAHIGLARMKQRQHVGVSGWLVVRAVDDDIHHLWSTVDGRYSEGVSKR